MRLWYDCTKSARAAHHSGLLRVAQRLRSELGALVPPPALMATRDAEWTTTAARDDWFLTPEVFAPAERLGFADALAQRPCRMAAIFHDAIPLKLPHVTWPQSVGRHPFYLKMLASLDLVFAISEASKCELLAYWDWLGIARSQQPPVHPLALGADFDASPRRTLAPAPEPTPPAAPPLLLCLGIIEPRKNQGFLLDLLEREELAAQLSRGAFELHFVGRVNPHFGKPVAARIVRALRRWPGRVHYHKALGDAELAQLYARTAATLFPTLAEGCGLPLLESLWRGLPCLCSDLPPLRENAAGGGVCLLPPNDAAAWAAALSEFAAKGSALRARLQSEAAARDLPTWAGAARTITHALKGFSPRSGDHGRSI